MSNALKYIRDLEAVGFQREQAEVQVQILLDVLEGELMTKSDLAVLKGDLAVFKSEIDNRFLKVDARFDQVESRFEQVESKMVEMELRLVTRLGFVVVSSVTTAVALLGWLIKQ